jgi:hypothetical protein
MRHSTLALVTALSMPVSASADVTFDETAILQGFVDIPEATLMLVVGTGWPTARIDPDNRQNTERSPIYSLQGRFTLSEKLGLLLGLDHVQLDAEATSNEYRAHVMMRNGDSPVAIVFTYELSDPAGSAGDADMFGLGVRCNF